MEYARVVLPPVSAARLLGKLAAQLEQRQDTAAGSA
jgi:hypothetical protein